MVPESSVWPGSQAVTWLVVADVQTTGPTELGTGLHSVQPLTVSSAPCVLHVTVGEP